MTAKTDGTEVGPPIAESVRKMLAGVSVLVGVCVAGAVGYLAAGWSLPDAMFMVVITIFGVGYGEVRPIDTLALRGLTGFVIVAGYGAVIYTVGGFIQMVIDGQLNRAFGARKTRKEIARMEGHTIICGLGRMGASLAAELHAVGHRFVAIDEDPGAVERARERYELVISGDAADEDVLMAAGIDRASVLATVLSADATNVFVTLTARAMNPDITILARGENRHTESKLRTCGADQVVLPTDIGATRISQLIVRPSAEEMLDSIGSSGDLDLVQLGLEFDEIELQSSSPLANRVIGDIEVRGAYGYLIIAVRRVDGTTVMHPRSDLRLAIGDRLIVLGYEDDLPRLGSKEPSRTVTYRGVTSEV
ncbi:MAG: potassium channel protein [Acidimicrobiales bacterium]